MKCFENVLFRSKHKEIVLTGLLEIMEGIGTFLELVKELDEAFCFELSS
jgi:hypothetical protein